MNFTYYPLQKQWRKLRPVFEQPSIIRLAHQEMEAYSLGRAEDYGYPFKPRPFSLDLRPFDYNSCDWFLGRRGPLPGYFQWTCHSACHWTAAINHEVIRQLEPNRPWQMVTSQKHTTIADLERGLLFDTNFSALGIAPDEAWSLAAEQEDSEVFPVGVTFQHNLEADEEEEVAA